jgi:hypothetical protein
VVRLVFNDGGSGSQWRFGSKVFSGGGGAGEGSSSMRRISARGFSFAAR